MNSMSKLTHSILTIAITFAFSAMAQELRVESYPSNRLFGSQILLHVPPKRPVGLLVLLAGDTHSYEKQSSYPPSSLPEMLATNGVMPGISLITMTPGPLPMR